MNSDLSPDRVAEAMARAEKQWRQQRNSQAANPGWTVAVSRETGTTGSAIAREVGRRLRWPVYDSELVKRIADDLGVRKTLVDKVDERQPGWLEETMSDLVSAPRVNEAVFFRHLLETLLSLSKIGECVIVGRGATKALPLTSTLRVRVVAPFEFRVAAVAREQGIALDAAAARIKATDRDRNEFLRSHFRVDPTDPAGYDVTLNAARVSVADAAELVVSALEKMKSAMPSDIADRVAVG